MKSRISHQREGLKLRMSFHIRMYFPSFHVSCSTLWQAGLVRETISVSDHLLKPSQMRENQPPHLSAQYLGPWSIGPCSEQMRFWDHHHKSYRNNNSATSTKSTRQPVTCLFIHSFEKHALNMRYDPDTVDGEMARTLNYPPVQTYQRPWLTLNT